MAVKSLIQTVTVGSGGAASIEFTGIDQTGQDLQILVSARSQVSGLWASLDLQFNNDTATNYGYVTLLGRSDSGVATIAASPANIRAQEAVGGQSTTANTFSNSSTYISNYTSSNAKSVSGDFVNENNATAARQLIVAGSYSGTSPITSVKLFMSSNFAEYSTASLFKIKYD